MREFPQNGKSKMTDLPFMLYLKDIKTPIQISFFIWMIKCFEREPITYLFGLDKDKKRIN